MQMHTHLSRKHLHMLMQLVMQPMDSSICFCALPDAARAAAGAQMHGAKPGVLPEELRRALGMAETAPPPWLINMQRYGPPPSYPDLKARRASSHGSSVFTWTA